MPATSCEANEMSRQRISRSALIWFGIAMLAIGNGLLRDTVVAPLLGLSVALPLSGISLSLIVFAVTYLAFDYLGPASAAECLYVGIQWVTMTLAFEFLFGHFVVGKPWSGLLQSFNPASGDLFLLVLVVSLLSPYVVARIKGL